MCGVVVMGRRRRRERIGMVVGFVGEYVSVNVDVDIRRGRGEEEDESVKGRVVDELGKGVGKIRMG